MSAQNKFARLRGKHVLIIGASSGLGFAVAEGVLELGGSVAIASFTAARINAAVDKLKAAYPGSEVTGLTATLSDDKTLESSIVALFEGATNGNTKKLDHVVFSAGDPMVITPVAEITIDILYDAQRIRINTPMLIAKHIPKYVNPGRESSFTITSGSIGQKPMAGRNTLGAFVGSHHSMARALSLELAPLRVNVVAPDVVDTRMWDSLPEDERKSLFEARTKGLTTGVIASAEDVAHGYLFCMQDWNLAGSVISTNGGALLT